MVLTRSVAVLLAAILIVLETVFCKELVNTAFNVVPGGQALTHVEKLVSPDINKNGIEMPLMVQTQSGFLSYIVIVMLIFVVVTI